MCTGLPSTRSTTCRTRRCERWQGGSDGTAFSRNKEYKILNTYPGKDFHPLHSLSSYIVSSSNMLSATQQTSAMPVNKDKDNFNSTEKNPNYFGTAEVWQKYHDVRPAYPKALFDVIFDYHRKHSGSWELAADFGSGPGTIVPELASEFKRVEASDLNEWQVNTGRELLQKTFGADRIGFHVGAAGECTWVKDGSADLFIAAEAAQWFDMAKWGQEAASKLRSGGTIAMIYYGCNATIIDPPEAAPHCNKLFSLLFETTWAQIGFPKNALLPHVTKFDCMALPNDTFDKKKEERHKWDLPVNVAGPYGLGENAPSSRGLFESVPDFSEGSSQFQYDGENGKCLLQRSNWTTDDLLEYIKSLGMPMDNLTNHPEYKQTMDDLHQAIGGPKGTFTAGWWCTLVLATRK